MKPYKLLIFDWDGTLMDSAAHIVECMKNAAREAGFEPAPTAAIRAIIGLSLPHAIQQLYPSLSLAQVRQIEEEYRAEYLVRNPRACPLFEGAEALLRDLSKAGYELAVATGKSRRGLDVSLQASGLADLFPITRCADETFSKPHPLMLEEILTDYNRKASEALMIGDSIYDLQMATAIKMDALAVAYGVSSYAELQRYEPRGCLEKITDLSNWLQ